VSPLAGYRRIDGTVVAHSLADLTDGTLDATINVTDSGGTSSSDVWTATNSTGEATTPSCNNWTSSSSLVSGLYGRSSVTVATWTYYLNGTCNGARRLYCFEI
jgi:hypothetical protein